MKVPIQIYLEKDKKTEWEKYADSHGMSVTSLIKNAVDYFIENSDKVHESAPLISTTDLQERILTKALQMLRGDSDKSMIDVYTHLSPEQVRQEYLKAMPKIF